MARDELPLPSFATDEEAERFVDEADLSEYDLSGGVPIRYEFKPKTASISMRVPAALVTAVKEAAAAEGVPYQRYIRMKLEEAVAARGRKRG